jgi:uncharacterized protein YjdB
MKKTFLRILPLAAAVLLATSCSKDNDNATEVVNNGQETVQAKTYPISITVNQKGLSKLSCTGAMGEALQPTFENSDKLSIYNGETLLKELTPTTISAGGKTATFEGEIVANGLVDDVTELTAKIGTPITEAVTATSRENAVKSGCYQTATFTYSSTGNNIALEEQNAYIEVVWENKGNSTVDFTIGGTSVPLDLNSDGQGWIVAPAGVTLTCEALGIAEAKTTVKGNIYGITRTFTNISLDKTTATIGVGETETLTATTVPNGQEVTWTSSDQSVATVANGVVTAKKVGTTTITAAFGELTATCEVTVVQKVTSISISGGFSSSSSDPYVWGSETTNNKTLTATVLPDDATNRTLEWSSNATNVTVDENGKITIIAPNTNTSTQTITITATAKDGSGESATYTLYLANYVQLAGAEWYTYDSQTSVSWYDRANGAPSGSAVPSKSQLEDLINTNNVNISGNNITSKNGSNAYITLTDGDYWSSTDSMCLDASYLSFYSFDRGVYDKELDNLCRVRLVRAQ